MLYFATSIPLLVVLLSGMMCFVCTTVCSTIDDEKALQEKLMQGYNRNIRPMFNHDDPVKINMSFSLVSILSFDEKLSKFSFVGVFNFYWIAETMKWNQSDYGGLRDTFFPQQSIWYPLLVPGNPYSELIPLGGEETNVNNPVRLFSDGAVWWSTGNVYEIKCIANIRYYPFDTQTCYSRVLPWFYSKNEIFLQLGSNKVDLSLYQGNGLWDLTSAPVEVREDNVRQYFRISFEIKRRSSFYVVNLLIPIAAIGLLNSLVFVMPPESGERVSFAVTVLLAMAVFLTIVSDKLPETSEPTLSMLSFFLLSDIVISALITMCTILGVRYHHKTKENHMSSLYKYIGRAYMRTVCSDKRVYLQDEKTKPKAFDYRLTNDNSRTRLKNNNIVGTSTVKSMNTHSSCATRGLPRILVDAEETQNNQRTIKDIHSERERHIADTQSSTVKSKSSHTVMISKYSHSNRGLPKILVEAEEIQNFQRTKKGMSSDEESTKIHNDVTWSDVARAIDVVFFGLFLSILIIKNSLMLLVFVLFMM